MKPKNAKFPTWPTSQHMTNQSLVVRTPFPRQRRGPLWTKYLANSGSEDLNVIINVAGNA